MILILLTVIIVAAVVVIFLNKSGGSSNPSSTTTPAAAASSTAPAPTTGAASATTTASSSGSAKVVAQINLTPPVATQQGSRDRRGAQGGQLGRDRDRGPERHRRTRPSRPTPTRSGSTTPRPIRTSSGSSTLGSGRNGKLSTAGGLPANASHYKQLIVTLETKASPKTPGTIILQGTLTPGRAPRCGARRQPQTRSRPSSASSSLPRVARRSMKLAETRIAPQLLLMTDRDLGAGTGRRELDRDLRRVEHALERRADDLLPPHSEPPAARS